MTQKHNYLIGREWHDAIHCIPVTNPYTQEVFAEVCMANEDEIKRSIGLSVKAFETSKNHPAYFRSRVCTQIAQGIKNRSEEFARLITMECGKPLIYSRGEVVRSISTFTIAAEEALRIPGELLNLDITEAARGKIGLIQIGRASCRERV